MGMSNKMRTALMRALVTLGIGLAVTWQWKMVQGAISSLISGYLYSLATCSAVAGIYLATALLVTGALPPSNRWRMGGYTLGVFSFLTSLVGAENAGSVTLESALLGAMLWSAIANGLHSAPPNPDPRVWIKAISGVVIGLVFGLVVVLFWPVADGSEFVWWGFPYLGQLGAIVLFVGVQLLEAGVLDGGKRYQIMNGIGSGLLVLSYLGQYNTAGLMMNAGLVFVMFIWPKLAPRFPIR